jgi:integrase
MRQSDGQITNVRIEDPTREESKAKATRVAEQIYEYYLEQAYRPKPKSVGFDEACITYVESKNCSLRDRDFLRKLIEHFKDMPISDIGQTEVADAACRLYPGCKASTHHRAVYAPVTMVLRLAGLTPSFKKPKIERVSKEIPDDEWFEAILPHCSKQLRAYLLFLTITGRRPTEALEAIYDTETRQAIIPKSKTGRPFRVAIPDSVCLLLGDASSGSRLFSYGDRHNVYRDLRPVCEKLGLRFYGLHAIGRHSAATRLLKGGYSTKFVSEALGWASTRMVDQHYGHLAKDEVAEEAQKVGEAWLKKSSSSS